MVRKHGLQRTLAAVLGFFVFTTQGHAFSGGSGTRINPYLIATVEDLTSIGSDPDLLQSHFRLVNDIDLDPNLPGGKVFDGAVIAPLHYECEHNCVVAVSGARLKWPLYVGTPFTGTFDGNGYEITNLVMSGEGKFGLIGEIDPGGFVHDLVLSNFSVTGVGARSITALLTPENEGAVSNCHIKGNIHRPYGGSLVKFNHGIIQHCSAEARLIGKGGLVEYNTGFIRACYASVLQESGSLSGGLVGWNAGTIIDCYAAGESNSRCPSFSGSGGFVGHNEGNVINCYANSTTSTPDPNSCTLPFEMNPNFRLGPFIGENEGNTRSCYYVETTLDNSVGISLSDADMQDASSFTGWDFYDPLSNGDDGNWFMAEGNYPVLSWQTEYTGSVKIPAVQYKALADIADYFHRLGLTVGQIRYDYDGRIPAERAIRTDPLRYATLGSAVDIILSQGPYDWTENTGSGSADSPFRIATPGQFDCLTHDSRLWDRHSTLTQDIDIGHCLYRRSPIAWDPNIFDSEFQGAPFVGSFDGNGFSIRGFTLIEADWSIYTGLFGYVDANAVIRNLGLDNGLVSIGRNGFMTGALAGHNNGTVHHCYSSGIVTASGEGSSDDEIYLGGLVGVNRGVVQDCHTEGILMFGSGGSHIGGLVGENLGSTINCSSTHDYLGGSGFSIGGLVGHNTGYISRSMASGVMIMAEGSHDIGGLVGTLDASGDWRKGRSSERMNPDGPVITREYFREGNEEACVRQSYAECDIRCARCCYNVGGVVGAGANVVDCYAIGGITAENPLVMGGLVGQADGLIKNCYVLTDIAVSESSSFWDSCHGPGRRRHHRVGGGLGIIIGEMDEDVEVTSCYFLARYGASVFENGIGIGLGYPEWTELESFKGWDFVGETENGTEDVWMIPDEGLPLLNWQ